MQRHADSKKKVVATSSKLYEQGVCVRARHRCAFKTHVRLVHLRRTRVSVMCEACPRGRDFAPSHREASHLIKLDCGFSFALCHKQTRTVANLAYTSITSHLPNK